MGISQRFLACLGLIVSLVISCSVYPQNSYSIYGLITDSLGKGLPEAKVQVTGSKKLSLSGSSGKDGNFTIIAKSIEPFIVIVSLKGYKTYTSEQYRPKEGGKISVGTISLKKEAVVVMNKKELVLNRMTSLNYLPTQGAYTLFYAMNPDLRQLDMVPVGYKINSPVLPSFKPVRRVFRKRFKKDKKREEPFVYAMNARQNIDNRAFALNFDSKKSSLLSRVNSLGLSQFDHCSLENLEGNDEAIYFAGQTKKFAFAFYRLDQNGKPVFENGRYKVFYYSDNVQGNESLYNKTPDATYGYAPMKARIYHIEVYDQQQNNKRIIVSDNQVDPQVYFLRNEIINSWIKIPIQIL